METKVQAENIEDKDDSESYEFDPFDEREVEKPIKDWEAFIFFIRIELGVGVLSLPYAFHLAGFIVGVCGTIFIAFISGHCNYMLIQTAHKLYYKTMTTAMTYDEVVSSAFENGPEVYKKLKHPFRVFSVVALMCIYFGACCVFTIFVAQNIHQIVDNPNLPLRMFIALMLPILIAFCFIPTLKYMSPISMIANVCFAFAVVLIFYKACSTFPDTLNDHRLVGFEDLPTFCFICVFAFQTSGHVMLIENSMKNPKHLIGTFGMMPMALVVVAVFYVVFGIVGYAAVGSAIKPLISLNFEDSWEIVTVQLCISVAVLGTLSLMVIVAIQLMWKETEKVFGKHEKIGITTVRLVFPTCVVILSLVIPSVLPFMGLISSILLSILGFIVPATVDCLVRTGPDFGPGKWRLIKNIFIILFGLFSLCIGTYASLLEIIDLYR